MFNVAALKERINILDAPLELTGEEIFDIVVGEFDIDGSTIEADLGCKCCYALIGYLEAMLLDD